MKENSQAFEAALKRLEGIVESLESSEVSLEDALKQYEEGIKLVRLCTKKLQEAEKKIEILCRGEDGKVAKKRFSVEKNVQTEDKIPEEGLLF